MPWKTSADQAIEDARKPFNKGVLWLVFAGVLLVVGNSPSDWAEWRVWAAARLDTAVGWFSEAPPGQAVPTEPHVMSGWVWLIARAAAVVACLFLWHRSVAKRHERELEEAKARAEKAAGALAAEIRSERELRESAERTLAKAPQKATVEALESDVASLKQEKEKVEADLANARTHPAVILTAIKRRLALHAESCDDLYRKVRVARDHLTAVCPANAELTARYVKIALDGWEELRLALERDLRLALEAPALRAFPSEKLAGNYQNGEVQHWNERLAAIKDTEAYLRTTIDNIQPHHRRPGFYGWPDA